jgi:hypothetical protein
MARRRVKFAVLALVVSLALFIVPELLWPTPFKDLRIKAEVYTLNDLNLAVAVFRRERGAPPASIEHLYREKYIMGPAATDQWGHLRVYRQRADGQAQIYSAGANGKDEEGGGDDVVVGPKTYSCQDYGVNCPRSLSEWGKISILAVALCSALALVLETIAWIVPAVLGRIRRSADHRSGS